jgi:2-polyprenyl-6-methoxyphenol hydroxylase-like FAD-dependent oxidoreductase
VVVLDRAGFPSDTLSTHVVFPTGVAELSRLGALERVRALGAPRLPWIQMTVAGRHLRERYTPVEGIDYAICQPRPGLDHALVETAREAGADVREQVTAESLLWDAGRVSGVRWRSRRGERGELRARLVVGADGRRSTVASLVGADPPYRGSRNGRGLAFWYMDDPKAGTSWREVLGQWRAGTTHGMVFPCPDDRIVVLFMGPAEEIPDFRADPDGMWRRTLTENRRLADRLDDVTSPAELRGTKLRATGDTVAFFRASSGPGWALVGDAGHFKDPVIAQGIRDALRFGRLLGEAAAPVLDDPAALDAALHEWERRRDRDCLPAYHWANRETRVEQPWQLLLAATEDMGASSDPLFSDALNRVRDPEEVFSGPRVARWTLRALLRPGARRGAILRDIAREARVVVDVRRERARDVFRDSRPTASEAPGWEWPPAGPGATSRARVPARERQEAVA